MKIGIYTGRSLNPIHPRLESIVHFFNENGIEYDIIPPSYHRILSKINWLSLYLFDTYSVLANSKKVKLYDTIFIQDLKYLPLSKYSKKNKKCVIYETLDNNVSLRLYDLLKKLPVLKPFQKCVSKFFVSREKKYVYKYCDKVIVNSKALLQYFDNKAELIYYSSSFEAIKIKNDKTKPSALIYLGEFSFDKGADDVLKISKQFGVPLFIFGTIRSVELLTAISNDNSIHHSERINHTELILRLEDLLNKYYLIGTSFIKSVHYSYATQEANKDIDYLSLGIPIIGNHRLPTEEKVLAGCGVFLEDESKINMLLSYQVFRENVTKNCREYYNSFYSLNEFNSRIGQIFSSHNKSKE